MSADTKVTEIADEISACRFRFNYSEKEYEWLAGKCHDLTVILKEAKADPSLIEKLSAISNDLAWQNQQLQHDLLRQQTLIFNQDAILFYLMKEGYLKMLRF